MVRVVNIMPRSVPESIGSLLVVALVLSACGGGGGGGSRSRTSGDQIVIQPIQLCNDAGSSCAQMDFFEAVTAKIWAQAGLSVTFLTPNRLNDSTYLSIAPGSGTDSEFYTLAFAGNAGAFGRHPSSTRDGGPINMWFVDTIETASAGLVQFGSAWVGANGVLISDDIYSFNGGIGRLDVIAHEIGHNLGLRHSTFGAGGSNNLMTDGTRRTIPSSTADITPDGAALDQLTSEQIQVATNSSLLLSSSQAASLDQAAADTQFISPQINPIASADASYKVKGNPVTNVTHQKFSRHDIGDVTLTQQIPESEIPILGWLSIPLGGFWLKRWI